MSKDAEFKRQACIVLWLNCSAAISESLLVIGQPLLNPTLWQGQLLKSLVSLLSFNQRTTITQIKVNILTWNFHIIFLMINQHNPWHYGWPCPPSLQSGTLNIFQVTPFLTPPSWRTYNWDINTRFSGYLPWGKKTSFMTSWTTMSSMSLVRNP